MGPLSSEPEDFNPKTFGGLLYSISFPSPPFALGESKWLEVRERGVVLYRRGKVVEKIEISDGNSIEELTKDYEYKLGPKGYKLTSSGLVSHNGPSDTFIEIAHSVSKNH